MGMFLDGDDVIVFGSTTLGVAWFHVDWGTGAATKIPLKKPTFCDLAVFAEGRLWGSISNGTERACSWGLNGEREMLHQVGWSDSCVYASIDGVRYGKFRTRARTEHAVSWAADGTAAELPGVKPDHYEPADPDLSAVNVSELHAVLPPETKESAVNAVQVQDGRTRAFGWAWDGRGDKYDQRVRGRAVGEARRLAGGEEVGQSRVTEFTSTSSSGWSLPSVATDPIASMTSMPSTTSPKTA